MRNMKQTIFIVEASFGSWEDAHTRVLKAFFTKEDADRYVAKADKILTAMSEHIAEAFAKTSLDSGKFITYEEYVEASEMYEQTPEFQKALDIWCAHSEMENFNRCFIEEIEIR
jgi:hypothetical protein